MVPVIEPSAFACFSASSTVVTDLRVIEYYRGTIGSIEREKVICTGPRTWPQLTPIVITAPGPARTLGNFGKIGIALRVMVGYGRLCGTDSFFTEASYVSDR